MNESSLEILSSSEPWTRHQPSKRIIKRAAMLSKPKGGPSFLIPCSKKGMAVGFVGVNFISQNAMVVNGTIKKSWMVGCGCAKERYIGRN